MIKIFLDIDGVLTTNDEYFQDTKKFWESNEWAKELKVPYPFNKKCVETFNNILKNSSNVEIILSSDWKLHWDLKELDVIFKQNGVLLSPVDITENISNSFSRTRQRTTEIESYLRKHSMVDIESSNWIIIDDLTIGSYLPEEYKNRFFLTNDFYGINENGVKENMIKKIKEYETPKDNK